LDTLTFEGNQLIGVGKEDYGKPLAIWSFPEQNKLAEFQNSSVSGFNSTFSQDHSLIVTNNWWNGIEGWDATNGKLLFTIPKYADYVDSSMGISPDSHLLAWIRVGTARVFSIPDHQFLYTIDKLQGTNPADEFSSVPQNDVFFSPDGKLLVLNSVDGVQVRNANDGSLIRVLKREGIIARKCWPALYKKFAFSPDGYLLAIEYGDGSIGLWDVQAGNLLKVLASPFPTGCAYSDRVLFSLNGALLLWVSSSYHYDKEQFFYDDKVQVLGISP
jgi:WD40 repeat protein